MRRGGERPTGARSAAIAILLPFLLLQLVGSAQPADVVIDSLWRATGDEPEGRPLRVVARGSITLLPGAILWGDDGVDALPLQGVGRVAANRGGDAGDIILDAPLIIFAGGRIVLGEGGAGGNALALGQPEGTAVGGDGGRGGRLIIQGAVNGIPAISGGDGGHGGSATAMGGDAPRCDGQPGGAAVDRRDNASQGPGQDAYANAGQGACGPVDGEGAPGGDAQAYGGNGGDAPHGLGGWGGNATAIAGRGGDGRSACFPTLDAAANAGIRHAGDGGTGGTPYAVGGRGGSGDDGGPGGNAIVVAFGGNGGDATTPIVTGKGGVALNNTRAPIGAVGGEGGEGRTGHGGAGGVGFTNTENGHRGRFCLLPPGSPTQPQGPPQGNDVGLPGVAALLALIALVALGLRRTR